MDIFLDPHQHMRLQAAAQEIFMEGWGKNSLGGGR